MMAKKKLFFKSGACMTRMHCALCRAKREGRTWRESMHRTFRFPNDEVDFDCPYGGKWSKPPPDAPPIILCRSGTPCVHLQSKIEDRQCAECAGLVNIAVFGCEIYGRCTMKPKFQDEKSCLTTKGLCDRYEPVPPKKEGGNITA